MNTKYINMYLIKPTTDGKREDTRLAVEYSDVEIQEFLNKGYFLVNNEDYNKLAGNADKQYSIALDGTLYETPPVVIPLEVVKTNKLTSLKSIRDTLEVEPIEYNGNLFDYDDKSRERLRNKRQEIEDKGGIGTIPWTLADNTEVVIGLQDFIGINNAATERAELLHFKYRTLREQVDKATTVEEVNAINW